LKDTISKLEQNKSEEIKYQSTRYLSEISQLKLKIEELQNLNHILQQEFEDNVTKQDHNNSIELNAIITENNKFKHE